MISVLATEDGFGHRKDAVGEEENFAALIEGVRPELVRYCARMMGGTIDGEDVVQETLARAFVERAALREAPALRGWLFRIAHNCAIDALAARSRRNGDVSVEDADVTDAEPTADEALDRAQAIQLALGCFLELAPAQRACVILKDVLGCSLEEVGEVLGLTVPAVKAALHRGRERLRGAPPVADASAPHPAPARRHAPAVLRYAELFNGRNFDGIRAMLAEDVKLDLVNREKRRGARNVGHYFANYERIGRCILRAAWLDGRPVLAAFLEAEELPAYVIVVESENGAIVEVRDFRYARHVLDGARLTF